MTKRPDTKGATLPTKRTIDTAPEYPKPRSTDPDDTDDTDDTDVRVSSTSVMPERPAPPGPLRLASEPRIETYERTAPGNIVIEVTRNIDTGQHSYHSTGRVGTEFRKDPDNG